jgi:hypothetical protein
VIEVDPVTAAPNDKSAVIRGDAKEMPKIELDFCTPKWTLATRLLSAIQIVLTQELVPNRITGEIRHAEKAMPKTLKCTDPEEGMSIDFVTLSR